MSDRVECAVAERIAGRIAIGEATDIQRERYRAHLAQCQRCVRDLAGEREIERTMATVARARDDERWEPDLRAALTRRGRPRYAWIWGTALAAAIAVILGARLTEPSRQSPPSQPAISAQEARALAALNTQSGPPREARAESLAVGSAMLSATLDVSVDQRGMPVRCTIARSSGDRGLDRAICRAAMGGRYAPQRQDSPKAR